MAEQLIIRLDSKTKAKLNNLTKSEGKTTSQVIRSLIEQYISEHDLSGYIDDLWGRIGKKLKAKGHSAESLKKVIQEVRAAKK